jgi:phenylpropionate dioxygenase-like ring-hydroxylating dioxygenase large terminal subunit
VCQHRGRRLRDEPHGNVRDGLYCRFHGWAYDLDGSLAYVPDREDFCPAALQDVALKPVRLERWAGWLWVNLDPDAVSLRDSLGPIVDIIAPLELEKTRRFWHATIHAPVNWKVVVGAFNEGYHSGATHDGWVSYRPLKSPSVIFGDHAMFYSEWSNFSSVRQPTGEWRQITDVREDIYIGCRHLHQNLKAIVLDPTALAAERVYNEVPEGSSIEDVLGAFWQFQREETEKTGAEWPANLQPSDLEKIGTDWHIFPSTIFLPAVDGALWYRVLPSKDGESCYFDIWSLGRYAPGQEPVVEDQYFESFESFEGNNPFLEEDFANMMAVQKGTHSRGWDGAILNPYQEKQQMVFMQVLQRYLADKPAPTAERRA